MIWSEVELKWGEADFRWNQETDIAFDSYYDLFALSGSLNLEEKETTFHNILYPAYVRLATRLIRSHNWVKRLNMFEEELINECVAYAWSKGNLLRHTNRDGYLYRCMQHYVFNLWVMKSQAKSVSINSLTENDTNDHIWLKELTYSPNEYDKDAQVEQFVACLIEWWKTIEFVECDCIYPKWLNKYLKEMFAVLIKYRECPLHFDISNEPISRTIHGNTLQLAYKQLALINRQLYEYYMQHGYLVNDTSILQPIDAYKQRKEVKRFPYSISPAMKRKRSNPLYGITFHEGSSKWRVGFNVDDRRMEVGYYSTKDEAIAARNQALKDFLT